MMWEKRSRMLFLAGLSIAAFVFLQMVMYLLYEVMGWDLSFNFFQLCKRTIHSIGFPAAGYGLDALILYTCAWALGIAARQLWLSRRFAAKLTTFLNREESSRLSDRHGLRQGSIYVIESPERLAFTIGFRQRRIVLSAGLLELLDENELAAVIHHEAYHQKHADPLKVFLLSMFSSVFWYLPVLKHIHANYKVVREVLADRHAIEQTGSMADLGRALLKLLKKGQALSGLEAAHVSFADTAINYRIQRMLDPGADVPFVLPARSVFISLGVILLLSELFWVSMI